MVNLRTLARFGAVAALVLAAGCGAGAPRPVAAPDGTPRDVRASVADPCALLTRAEAEGLGLASDTDVTDSGLALTCSWRLDEDEVGVQLNASAHADQPAALSHFGGLASPGSPRPVTVAGLPGLFTGPSTVPSNRCELGVLVSPTQTVELSLFVDRAPDPGCDIVWRAAEVMVRALPPRA